MRRALLIATILLAAPPLHAQRLIERTPNMPNAVTSLPGMLETSVTHRLSGNPAVTGLQSSSTFDLAFGLPFLLPLHWTGGVRFAPASIEGARDEWELYDRFGVLRQHAGAPLDVNLTGAWTVRAKSLDAELSLARRFGGLRVIAAARGFSNPVFRDEATFAVAGGVAWQPAPDRMPLTLAADAALLTDRQDGEEVAWSAGVQTGLPYTTLSLSVHATNTHGPMLQHASVGGRRTRWGVELNVPVEFAGYLLGVYASREHARRAVAGGVDEPAVHVVHISGYIYSPATLRVRAGDVIEWVNDDAMVHTVTSENGGFDSRGIRAGERWRARITERGTYPYYCSPHPFMKGVIVVR